MGRFAIFTIIIALIIPAETEANGSGVQTMAIQRALQRIADDIQKKYNCSIAAAFQSSSASITVASGYTDSGLGLGNPSRAAKTSDLYVWGSTTKMFTATTVFELIEAGKMSLEDSISKHIDPFLMEASNPNPNPDPKPRPQPQPLPNPCPYPYPNLNLWR